MEGEEILTQTINKSCDLTGFCSCLNRTWSAFEERIYFCIVWFEWTIHKTLILIYHHFYFLCFTQWPTNTIKYETMTSESNDNKGNDRAREMTTNKQKPQIQGWQFGEILSVSVSQIMWIRLHWMVQAIITIVQWFYILSVTGVSSYYSCGGNKSLFGWCVLKWCELIWFQTYNRIYAQWIPSSSDIGAPHRHFPVIGDKAIEEVGGDISSIPIQFPTAYRHSSPLFEPAQFGSHSSQGLWILERLNSIETDRF